MEYMECGVMWYVSHVKCGRCGGDLKYSIAKWNSVLREVLVRYETSDIGRNDGVT